MKKLQCILISSILLTACSTRYASNGENQYQSSQNGQNLVVPPSLTGDTISHFYDLPQPTQNSTVSSAPPAM